MDWRRSHVVEPDDAAEADDDHVSAKERAERNAVREKTRTFPGGFDLEAPHVRRWSGMPPEARAAGCLAAMLVRMPFHPDLFYYDPRARIVMAVEPDPDVQDRRRGTARRVPRTVEETLVTARAAFGVAGAEIANLIKRRG